MSVPVLSTTTVVTFSRTSRASALRNSTPSSAPRPVPTMMDIGVASPKAQGHATIRTATALTERMRQARLRTVERPDDERDDRDDDDDRDEPTGDVIREPLNRRARTLRLADHAHDLSQQRLGADTLGFHDERSGAVDGAARHLAARPFFHRDRLARHHRFVNRRRGRRWTTPSTGTRSPGRTRSRSPTRTCSSGISCSVPSYFDTPCRFRREAEQLFDRGARAAPRAQFEDLPEQDEHDDDRGRLEVDRHVPAHAKRMREQARNERRHHAVRVRGADTERDQREHVQVSADDRRPAALERTAIPPTKPQASRARARSNSTRPQAEAEAVAAQE